MSAYCEKRDVEQVYGAKNVAIWADLDNDGDADKIDERIERVIEFVSADIDSRFRRSMYALPLATAEDTVPAVIINVAATLCGVALYEARGVTDFNPETGQAVHKLNWNKKHAEDVIQSILTNSRVIDAVKNSTTAQPGPEVVNGED